ncbi:uncharacterized protein LOC124957199 [Vespa velutina]|uniref:uncharacterized protein LOC124957199 n=1 Tax=Vespa velutina TaxID=202808 RepID=UPI001FB4C394|nr:uncharacterized protein LOC124957199 [Vespa velutina]
MSLLMLVLALCGILTLYIYCRKIYSYWNRQGIPEVPYPLPIIGHLLPLLLLQKSIPQMVMNWYDRYKNKSMVGYYDGTVPGLLIRDPELIKMILQTNFTNFHENAMKVDKHIDPLIAKNPFFLEKEEWLINRKRLTYAFSSMRLKILSETIRKVCKKFDDYLYKKIQNDQRIEFETKDLFSRFTGEVVANAGYGIEGFCFDDNYNPQSFHEMGKKLFRTGWLQSALQSLIFFVPFLNNYLKIRLIPKDIDHYFRTMVKQIIEQRREEKEKRNDFFQLMIDLAKSNHQKFDEESLSANALTFFVDGYETSSITLSFICFELSIHCNIQEKLRKEIKQVLDKHQGEITYDSLKEMTYLDQVINESQRLNTVLDVMGKMCTDGIQMKGNDGLTCTVEPGTKMIIPVRALQRDPKYWINPEAFDPDRWNEQRKSEINKYCFLPFGEGPRICVGLRMALLQIKAAIAILLMKYKIERNSRTCYPVKIDNFGILSTSIDGLWVYLRRLMKFTILTQPEHNRHTNGTQSGYRVQMQPECKQDTIQMQPESIQGTVQMQPGCNQNKTKKKRIMSLLMLVLALCGILTLYIYCRKIYSYWNRQGIPEVPYSLPIIGHLLPLLLMQKSIPQMVMNWYDRYKNNSMVGYYDGTVPGLLIRDPELIKMVLQTNFKNFHENALKVDKDVDPLVAKNPFFSKGDEWLISRKRLTYAFSSMRLKILSETVRKVCKKFDDYLYKKIQDDQRIEFETKDLFSRFTGEVVANAGYGIEGFCFDDNYNPQSFHEMGKKIFRIGWLQSALQSIMFFLPFLNNYLKIQLIPKDIDHYFRTIVKQIIEQRREEKEKRNDFFQLMVDLEKSEGQKFDEESLSAHALSFFVDGYETSSATLSFICFELSIHCNIQEKLRKEIKQVLDKHQGEITYDSLKEMTYLDQVINESQRLNTLLDTMGKMCTDGIQMKGNDGLTCTVEPGTKMIIPVRALQRDPKYWINPEAFDPDRWNEQRKSEINKYCFLPFGEGPRICVGLRMALLQIKAAIAILLMKYKIERNSRTCYPVKIDKFGILSTPIDGLWVYLRRL